MDNEISNDNFVKTIDLNKPFKVDYVGVLNYLHYWNLVNLKKRIIEHGGEVSDEFNDALKIDQESIWSFSEYFSLASAAKHLRELDESESEK